MASSILLSQALRNKDDKALNSLVARTKEAVVIYKTVKELPVDDVLPFLQYVEEQIQEGKLEKYVLNLITKQVLFLKYLLSFNV